MILQSVDKLIGTAEAVFPRTAQLANKPLEEIVRRGDNVSIDAGYDGKYTPRFRGTVTRVRKVRRGEKIKVEAEDAGGALRDKVVDKTWEDADIQDVVPDLYSGQAVVRSAKIGDLTSENGTAAAVLQKLREKFFQRSYFRLDDNAQPVLRVGDIYDKKVDGITKLLVLDLNVDLQSSSIKFKRAEELKLKVKVVNHKDDASKDTVELGASEGDLRTLHTYNHPNPKQYGQDWLDQNRYDGLQGQLVTFGDPAVQAGQIIEIIDPRFPERDGTYLVDKVKTEISVNAGLMQHLTLGPKI